MTLVVVNRHHVKGPYPEGGIYVYVGRAGRIADEEIARGCLDGTAFGNPFHRDGRTPLGEILARYKAWLWGRLCEEDEELIGFLFDIPDGAILTCSCAAPAGKPRKPCHAYVIAAAWDVGPSRLRQAAAKKRARR